MQPGFALSDFAYTHPKFHEQEDQRVRYERLKQQRNRMENMSQIICGNQHTISELQENLLVVETAHRRVDLSYRELQCQFVQLQEKQRMTEQQLLNERAQKTRQTLIAAQLREELFRKQSENKIIRMDLSVARNYPKYLQEEQSEVTYARLYQKCMKLERKLAKRQKQNSILKGEVRQFGNSLDKRLYPNRNSNYDNTDDIIRLLSESTSTELKSLKKCLKKSHAMNNFQDSRLERKASERNMKVCPCHYIGKSMSKSKRRYNEADSECSQRIR